MVDVTNYANDETVSGITVVSKKVNPDGSVTDKSMKIAPDVNGNVGITTGAGWIIKDDGNGNISFFPPNSTEYINISHGFSDNFFFNMQVASGTAVIQNASGHLRFYDSSNNHIIDFVGGIITTYNNVSTAGYGVPPIYGLDNRTGLTAVDASPITLYPKTGQPAIVSGQLYRLSARIMATVLGTGGSATYTLKWVEGGQTIPKTLTVSAVDSDSDLMILIQPDANTQITAQLTAISGTGTSVNVAASVEQIA